MRPIKLKISGLNSYIETQTIDFAKLTERGLFGIFGPTGCGKSTILDAIILSLYGHKGQKGIPRSTNEFINTATDQASISYLFGLDTDDGPRKVLVERKFKRTDTGLSTSFSRLQLMTADEDVVDVWDKTTDVSNQVVDLLGLTREDFMRSVVLPQGKFSEFLVLEGKERRDMLERLLSLKDYGSALQMKIKRRGDVVKSRMLQMEGEMKRYSEVTPETIEASRAELKVCTEKESELDTVFSSLEKEVAAGERLHKVIVALKDVEKQMEQLNAQIPLMQEEKGILERADAAEKIWPYYAQLQKTEELIAELDKQIEENEKLHRASKDDYESKKSTFDDFLKTYDKEKDTLTLKKSDIEKARDHKVKAETLTKEREALILVYKKLQAENKLQTQVIEDIEKKLVEAESKIVELDAEKEKLVVPTGERERILDGLKKEELHKKQSDLQRKLDGDIKSITLSLKVTNSAHEEESAKEESLKKKRAELLEALESKQNALQSLPAKRSALDTQSNQRKLEHEALSEKLENKAALVEKIELATKELKALRNKAEELKHRLDDSKEQLDKAEKDRMAFWTESVLSKLADELEQSDACPLCGSEEHPHIHVKSDVAAGSNWEEAEAKWRQANLAFDKNESEIEVSVKKVSELDENLLKLADITEEKLNLITEEIKDTGLQLSKLDEEHHELKTAYEKDVEMKRKLDADIELSGLKLRDLRTSQANQEAKLSSKKEQQDLVTDDVKKLESELDLEDGKYLYQARYEELKDKDRRLVSVEKSLETLRRDNGTSREKLETLKKASHKIQLEMQSTVEKGGGLKDRIESHEAEVRKVAGDLNIDDVYRDTVSKLESLAASNEALKEGLKISEERFRKIASSLESLKGKHALSKINKDDEALKFESALEKSIIDSLEVLKASHIEKAQLQERKQRLSEFYDSLSILKDRRNELEKERNGRDLSEEDWNALLQRHFSAKEALGLERDKRIQLTERLKNLEKEMSQFERILERYQKYEQVGDLVHDLLDLVRGNKFVEYVAVTHLKYIALDASKRLMDITNHRYSLELDAKGNFIICDHYNGGVKRDTKTLSGGETFLTALSLSLALSSQIQLRGRTNLEFFFLDEGFGTLDNELLDIVMTSLEKLFHEKLTVGIISHVDELKNRVPIKLTVEPAQAGVHGTKTRIEVT